jgi:murein endopeptidase
MNVPILIAKLFFIFGPYGPIIDDGAPSPSGLDYPLRPECTSQVLRDSLRLPEDPTLFKIWHPDTAYGTPELVDALQIAAQYMEWVMPTAEPIVVGDMSLPRGGHLSGHRSHRGGLDADIGIYFDQGRQYKQGFLVVEPAALDLEANWLLIRTLLDTGLVERILLDRAFIARLRAYVVRTGELSPEEAIRIFPQDEDPWMMSGVVNHVPGHRHHMHVRVHCYDEAAW